jgi:hypothetical protein
MAVGEGLVLRDGAVDWTAFHQIALDLHRAGPQPVPADEEPRFDNGALPEPPMHRRARPVQNPEAHDTDSDTAERSVDNGTDD